MNQRYALLSKSQWPGLPKGRQIASGESASLLLKKPHSIEALAEALTSIGIAKG
jgi:hypothetical protein